jgi:RNA polymerase sigma factor (sigma-70 family)
MNALLPFLLARCEAVLKSKVAATLSNAEEIRENILSDFSLMFVEDIHEEEDDELDYFECRFNAAFRTFRIDFIRRERSRLREFVLVPEEADSSDGRSGEEKLSRISDAFTPATQESDMFRKELADAIIALPPEERKAVVLRYGYGMQIESKDPSEETVATLCCVTPKTIHNRLARAIEKLSIFKEGRR